ncbi:synembryn-A isoform X2 [Stegostoma tigrinum]|uniref:synembryn-A isoform X2 n=1 Tax=Stegostoma tigrinum TaxID=3053191 RepID=UPI00202B7A60|nr:synembryn-A isoform X2 [Stegostoma tigrinum]
MELSRLIEQIESEDQDIVLAALQLHNTENSQRFLFDVEDRELRQKLGKLVIKFLERDLQPACQVACLGTVRILSRDKNNLRPFTTRGAMQTLARHAGIDYSEERMDGMPDVDVIVEALKCLCNVVFNSPTAQAISAESCMEDAALYRHLVAILRHCLLVKADGEDRTEELHSHTVNLLGNLPLMCLDVLLTPRVQLGSVEYLGMNMDAVNLLLEFLEKRLDRGHKLRETLIPALNLLTESARAHRETRKFLRMRVLPPLRDVQTRPEVGNLLRNKLVRLMTHIDTDLKHCAAEFLFVLCKESVARFVKYTGYGNAAGLLAARGLMGGRTVEGLYSEDEDTDTEEYKEAKPHINPVTGRVEERAVNPMDEMTDEQKEYEAMKLFNMFDKLSREQIIQPMGVTPDGKLAPLEEMMQHMVEVQETSDSDSDSD